MRAMDAGPIEELRAKYGDVREAEGFVHSEKLIPAIVFKPKEDTEGLTVHKVEITPGACTILQSL
jgi:hypothetical protein